jgi:molecular chaperone GrpE
MEKTVEQENDLGKQEEQGLDANKAAPDKAPQADGKVDSSELRKLQDDLADAKDKYLRLYAEFDNHRRRTAKEKLEMIQSANEQLLKALLPIADDFERAENAFKDRTDKESEGFLLIHNKFKKTLDQYGVKLMEAGKGGEFNPDFHEAITQIPTPDETLKGKIVDVVEKGYLLNDKVIRFAKVVVGS